MLALEENINLILIIKHTSSNFLHIIEKALLAFSTTPFMVTILSGVEPSDIVIRAPLFLFK